MIMKKEMSKNDKRIYRKIPARVNESNPLEGTLTNLCLTFAYEIAFFYMEKARVGLKMSKKSTETNLEFLMTQKFIFIMRMFLHLNAQRLTI